MKWQHKIRTSETPECWYNSMCKIERIGNKWHIILNDSKYLSFIDPCSFDNASEAKEYVLESCMGMFDWNMFKYDGVYVKCDSFNECVVFIAFAIINEIDIDIFRELKLAYMNSSRYYGNGARAFSVDVYSGANIYEFKDIYCAIVASLYK